MKRKYKRGFEKEPMATEGCILTNNEEMDSQRAVLVCKGWQEEEVDR